MTKNEKLQEGLRKLEELKNDIQEFSETTRGLNPKLQKTLIRLRKKILNAELKDIMKATR